jgi:hypothetical protein
MTDWCGRRLGVLDEKEDDQTKILVAEGANCSHRLSSQQIYFNWAGATTSSRQQHCLARVGARDHETRPLSSPGIKPLLTNAFHIKLGSKGKRNFLTEQ